MTLTALIDFADRSVLFREAHALVAGDLYNPLVLDFSQVPRPVADAVDLGSLALVLRRSQGGAVVASCPLFSAVPGRRSLRASSLSMTTKALADWYAELESGRRAVDADGWLEVSDRSLAYVACPVPVVLRDVEVRGDVAGYYTASQVDGLLAGKQDALSFDSAPSEGSPNPVTSGGVYAALAGKADTALAGKADASAVTALEEKVDGKADASAVAALEKSVEGKADAGAVAALEKSVEGKADASAVTALEGKVDGKADASAVTALEEKVGKLPASSDLESIVEALDGKLGADALDTALAGKADASAVTALEKSVEGKADASAVTALEEKVDGKADASAVAALEKSVEGKADAGAVAGKADASAVAALEKSVEGKADAGAVAALEKSVEGKADAGAVAALEEKVDELGRSSGTSVRFLAGDGVELRSGGDLLATVRIVTCDANGVVDRVVLVGEGVYSGTHDLSAGSSWSSWSSSGGAVSFSPATSSFSFSYDGAVVAVPAYLPSELGVPMSDVGDVAPTEGSSDRVATSGGTYGYVEGRIATRVSAELHGEDLVATRLLVAQNATSAAQNARGVAGNLRRVLAAEARGYDRGQVDLLVSGKADAFSVSPPLSLSDGALSVDLSSVVSSLSASLVAGVRVNGGAAPKASDGTVDVSAVTSVRLNGADVPVEGGVADVPAVSGVKLNGVAVAPDAAGVVDVRVAVGDAASWRFSSAEPSAMADGEYAAELCDGCVTSVGAPPAGASLALRLADSGTGRPRQYAFVLASAPSGFAVVDAATGSAAMCLGGVAAASALAALTGGSVAADRLYRLFETSAGTFAASAC